MFLLLSAHFVVIGDGGWGWLWSGQGDRDGRSGEEVQGGRNEITRQEIK